MYVYVYARSYMRRKPSKVGTKTVAEGHRDECIVTVNNVNNKDVSEH